MGRFDDLTADLQPTSSGKGGRFDDLTTDLTPSITNAERIEPGIYGDTDPAGQKMLEKLQTVAGGYGVGKLAGLGVAKAAGSTLGKAILNSPSDLSPEYDALHETAGISKNLPETGGRTARFPNLAGQPSKVPPSFAPGIAPINYPRDTNSMLNFMRQRMDSLPDHLSPQELNDYKTLISQAIDTGKVGAGKPFAMAAQLRAQASELLNSRVDGLEDLNKVYALSSKLRDPIQFLPNALQGLVQKYGPWIAKAAVGGAAVGAGLRISK